MKKLLKRIILVILVFAIILGGAYAWKTRNSCQKVETYRPQVETALAKYQLKADTQLVLAIIYTETKGGSVDVMQSSESTGAQKNTIASENESIDQGIQTLVEYLEYATQKGCDVWTAVQAYNFGKAYIDYVAAHGGVNTVKLADIYSRTVVAPSLGNTTSKTYTHLTWDSLFYNGGRLYTDGGNFFYANEVHFNFDLLKIFG